MHLRKMEDGRVTSLKKHAFLGIWEGEKGRPLNPATHHTEETVPMHSPTAGGKRIAELAPTEEIFGLQLILQLEDRMEEINKAERKKEKRIKRHEDNLRDLRDNVKHPNV